MSGRLCLVLCLHVVSSHMHSMLGSREEAQTVSFGTSLLMVSKYTEYYISLCVCAWHAPGSAYGMHACNEQWIILFTTDLSSVMFSARCCHRITDYIHACKPQDCNQHLVHGYVYNLLVHTRYSIHNNVHTYRWLWCMGQQ